MLSTPQEEISRLKAQLAAKQTGGTRVVEKRVEVEADAALMDQLRSQMKAEIEAKLKESLSAEAMKAAREQAEANAKKQLEVWAVSMSWRTEFV